MKLYSWNVNGIRAGIKKGTFFDFLENEKPDILGLQEVKARLEQLEEKDRNKIKEMGYQIFWNPAVRPGYSGTAVLSKIDSIKIYHGIDTKKITLKDDLDTVITENHEGRIITMEFRDFYFLNVYTPNSKTDLSRLEYRKLWDKVFLNYVKNLEKEKSVIICGDLNVAHNEIDLANPQANKTTQKKPGSAGFTDTEREGFQNFIKNELIDSFRYFYPNKEGMYSWWSNFGKARERNVGWRIDYFLTSKQLINKLNSSFILDKYFGSDHCPIGIELK